MTSAQSASFSPVRRTKLSGDQIIGFWAAWSGWTLDGMDSVIYALVLAPALLELLPRSGMEATPARVGFVGSVLFAVFLARPCPFYILDEVEAALDDLNIDRFLTLLRRHSSRVQFIVVTHQKRTMEAADWLYGVSMGGDGTSKVISRRLGSDGLAEVDADAA